MYCWLSVEHSIKKIDSDPEMKSGLDNIEKFISAVEFGKRD